VVVVARGSLSLFSPLFFITQTSLFLYKGIFEDAKIYEIIDLYARQKINNGTGNVPLQ